jgi:predicted nucleic acid-binding protein
MILVVADTAPLRYLIQINYEGLLSKLFSKVWIPGAVLVELRQAGAPAVVRQWAQHLPPWIEVRELDVSRPSRKDLADLDPGEREAIELAGQLNASCC